MRRKHSLDIFQSSCRSTGGASLAGTVLFFCKPWTWKQPATKQRHSNYPNFLLAFRRKGAGGFYPLAGCCRGWQGLTGGQSVGSQCLLWDSLCLELIKAFTLVLNCCMSTITMTEFSKLLISFLLWWKLTERTNRQNLTKYENQWTNE